nr:uncharacterized protein LOC133571910 [Nerophis lumbriciformis]
MAKYKNGLIILLATLCILKTGNVIKWLNGQLHSEERHIIKRATGDEHLVHYEYQVSIELNVTSVDTIDLLRSLLDNSSSSFALSASANVTHIDITTVCYSNGSDFQCRCEQDFVWSYDKCIIYGNCAAIIDDSCTCIASIPSDGQYCLSRTVANTSTTSGPTTANTTLFTNTTTQASTTKLPFGYESIISVELLTTDLSVINILKDILNATSYPISINNYSEISDINMTTVCSPSSDGFQCRCEDQHRWSCDQCFQYGSCDNITNDTCGCITGIPFDGQYCQSVDQYNLTSCPATTPSTTTTTYPPFVYESIISVELNTTDMSVIQLLKDILGNTSYPISINKYSEISDINITTVCSPSSDGFQCRCEDQHHWSCDQCFQYGSCDNITNDTCGCINSIPFDGQYCQSIDQHNLTSCPVTTPSTTTTTYPPFVYESIISVELNTTDMSVIQLLKDILRNTSYPISINNYSEISDINITTVCSPSSDGFQCRCEDQHRWSCDQCFQYGSCDNITNDTCGCINGIPFDGQYCQSIDQYNLTSCPVTTPSTTTTTYPPFVYESIISVELNTTDMSVIQLLKDILRNTSYPISINNYSEISDINITTVCSPSNDGFQCRCEDQHRWSCDQCIQYGSCDNITNDTCGCINSIPFDGQYCLSIDQYNTSGCPISTTLPTTHTTTASTTTTTTPTPTPTPMYSILMKYNNCQYNNNHNPNPNPNNKHNNKYNNCQYNNNPNPNPNNKHNNKYNNCQYNNNHNPNPNPNNKHNNKYNNCQYNNNPNPNNKHNNKYNNCQYNNTNNHNHNPNPNPNPNHNNNNKHNNNSLTCNSNNNSSFNYSVSTNRIFEPDCCVLARTPVGEAQPTFWTAQFMEDLKARFVQSQPTAGSDLLPPPRPPVLALQPARQPPPPSLPAQPSVLDLRPVRRHPPRRLLCNLLHRFHGNRLCRRVGHRFPHRVLHRSRRHDAQHRLNPQHLFLFQGGFRQLHHGCSACQHPLVLPVWRRLQWSPP